MRSSRKLMESSRRGGTILLEQRVYLIRSEKKHLTKVHN